MNKEMQSNYEVAIVSTEEQPSMKDAQYVNNRGFGGTKALEVTLSLVLIIQVYVIMEFFLCQ